MRFTEQDAPILIVFGQSNAHGHATHLPEQEQITVPLTNVFGLSSQNNQAYGLSDVTFEGFVTHGMNLGETQDHTYCLAEGFARIWQERTDRGEALPPLYIIQISIGAMGIAEHERDGLNMWWPNRPKKIVSDPLGAVDISLYPLALEILSLSVSHLKNAGKNPKVIGLHWNQWETEAHTGGESITNARTNYLELFEGFRNALGVPCTIWLYKPLSDVYCNPEGVAALTELFNEFVASGDEYTWMDLTRSTLYQDGRPDKGIFQGDLVHYHEGAQRLFAEIQEKEVFGIDK